MGCRFDTTKVKGMEYKMKTFTKKQALSIVVNCAKVYDDELNGRNLMIILIDTKTSTISNLEVSFHPYQFLHLTGLQTIEMSAADFYHRCINHKLREKDFEFASNGTTQLKLNILPYMITKNLSAKMAGDYNGSTIDLYTEKKLATHLDALVLLNRI